MSDWNLVRLELAKTPEFPEGSASRAYMLRVPLDINGLIDDAELASEPNMATVRRFWPNEPDQTGHIARNSRGWLLSCAIGDDDEPMSYHLELQPLHVGGYVHLTGPDGIALPFRVVRRQLNGLTGP